MTTTEKAEGIVPGKRYRITETYSTGTVVTFEGAVESATDDLITFKGNTSAWASDREGITVIVECVPDPVPTTRGSLIRFKINPDQGSFWYYAHLTDGDWVDDDRDLYSPQRMAEYEIREVLYVAPKEA